ARPRHRRLERDRLSHRSPAGARAMTASDGLNATPLNALHREAGARMVDFAGWSMPLHYGSQIEEHHRVRRDAGMFDVSHMLAVDVRGAGASELLRHALAN